MDTQTLLAEALTWLTQLPWGFIGGIASALIISWFANRHSLQQQKHQLHHEADQHRIERQVQMRREVYLEAAGAFVRMAACLGRGTNPSAALDTFDRVAEDFNVQVSRVLLIASNITIPTITAAQRAYMTEFMGMLRERHPSVLRQQDLDLSIRVSSDMREERRQYIDLMKSYQLDGVQDPRKWAAVRQHVDFLSERIQAETASWEILQREQQQDLSKLYVTVPQRAIHLLEFQNRALVAIRADLEQDGAADVLLTEMQINVEAMKKVYDSTISGLTAPVV